MQRFTIGLVGFLAGLVMTLPAHGENLTFSNLVDWQNAVAPISSDTRLIDFDGLPNQTEIGGAEMGPGAVFREYEGLGFFPRVDNDSAFGGGWLTNRNNGGFDEFVNGFVVDFTESVIAVSLNDNPREHVQLRVYDALDSMIAEVTSPVDQNFMGLVLDQPVAYATLINLRPEDGLFGMDNFRFAVGVIPEPSSIALVGLLGVLGTQRRVRG